MVNYLSSVKKRTKPPSMAEYHTILSLCPLSASLKNRPTNIAQSQQSVPYHSTASAAPTLSVKTPQCRSKYRSSRHAGYTLVRPEAPSAH